MTYIHIHTYTHTWGHTLKIKIINISIVLPNFFMPLYDFSLSHPTQTQATIGLVFLSLLITLYILGFHINRIRQYVVLFCSFTQYNNVVATLGCYRLYVHMLSFLLGKYLGVEWLDYMVNVWLTFSETTRLFIKAIVPF